MLAALQDLFVPVEQALLVLFSSKFYQSLFVPIIILLLQIAINVVTGRTHGRREQFLVGTDLVLAAIAVQLALIAEKIAHQQQGWSEFVMAMVLSAYFLFALGRLRRSVIRDAGYGSSLLEGDLESDTAGTTKPVPVLAIVVSNVLGGLLLAFVAGTI